MSWMRLLLTLLVLGAHSLALAAPACSVASSGLQFPGYNRFNPVPTDITGNITVSCTGQPGEAVGYSVQLNRGNSSSYTTRSLRFGNATLQYNLYTSAALSNVWGDGTSGSAPVQGSLLINQTNAVARHPVYGRIFANQNVPAGSYADSITITLSF